MSVLEGHEQMPGTSEEMQDNETRTALPLTKRRGIKNWQLFVGAMISLVFLILAFQGVDFGKMLSVLRGVNVTILCAAAANFILSVITKTARWRLLLATRKTPSFLRTFAVLSVGLVVNAFLPTRLGEFARAYLMGEAESDSKVYYLGTIAVEKASDLFSLMLILLLLLTQMVLPDWLADPARSTAIFLVIFVLIFILLVWKRELILRFAERMSKIMPVKWRDWFIRQLGDGLNSLDVMRKPRLIFGLFGYSLVIWAVSAMTNWLVFLSLRIVLPAWASLLLLVVLQIGTAVPSSPGSIGVFQYLVVLALSVFGLDKNISFGYSMVLYLVIFVPIALLGIWGLWHEKVTWGKFTEALRRFSEERKKG
jgi:glycosyltransferase 2 family protein